MLGYFIITVLEHTTEDKHENIACFSDLNIPIYVFWNLLELERFEICEGSEFAETKDERNESPDGHKYWQHGGAVILGVGVGHSGAAGFPPGWSWLLEYDLISNYSTTVVTTVVAQHPLLIWTPQSSLT